MPERPGRQPFDFQFLCRMLSLSSILGHLGDVGLTHRPNEKRDGLVQPRDVIVLLLLGMHLVVQASKRSEIRGWPEQQTVQTNRK